MGRGTDHDHARGGCAGRGDPGRRAFRGVDRRLERMPHWTAEQSWANLEPVYSFQALTRLKALFTRSIDFSVGFHPTGTGIVGNC